MKRLTEPHTQLQAPAGQLVPRLTRAPKHSFGAPRFTASSADTTPDTVEEARAELILAEEWVICRPMVHPEPSRLTGHSLGTKVMSQRPAHRVGPHDAPRAYGARGQVVIPFPA